MGVIIKRWVWLKCICVFSGCYFKEVYNYIGLLILRTYPYSNCISSFLQQHPYFFVKFFNVFCFCFCYCCAVKQMLLKEHSRSFKNGDHADMVI